MLNVRFLSFLVGSLVEGPRAVLLRQGCRECLKSSTSPTTFVHFVLLPAMMTSRHSLRGGRFETNDHRSGSGKVFAHTRTGFPHC